MKILFYLSYILLTVNLHAAATEKQRESFNQECKDGNAISCFNMGLMYEQGDGVSKSDEKALDFYTKSCEKNYFKSCSSAAVLYEESSSVKQDFQKAFNLYSKACGGEDAFACHNLAVYYAKKKTPAMKNISLLFYDKACDGGYALSCIYLGRIYRDSKSLTHNYQLAKEKFHLACEQNNYLGCKELRILEEAGH